MKVIKYQSLGCTGVWNSKTEEEEQKECLVGVEHPYTEDAYQKALAEAYNGKVTVEEVGEEEAAPTIEQRVTTLEESSAEITEALDLILSGVTE